MILLKSLWKRYIIIGLIVIVIILGIILQLTKKPWINVPKNLADQTVGTQTNTKQILYNGKLYNVLKQKNLSENQFSSPQMNIIFIYPGNIKEKQITPQLISLSDPSIKDTDTNTLYIYSTTVPENSLAFKIPFTVPGTLKQTKVIRTTNFVANQEEYSDGKNVVTLLVLRQKQQTIVLRIPPDSSYVSATISDIMNSIQLLH